MDWETYFYNLEGVDWQTISRSDNGETVVAVCSGCARFYFSPLRDLTKEDQIAAAGYLGYSVSADILTGNITFFGCDDNELEKELRQAFESGFRERNRNA